ncbi:uncharacterized protein [Dermacentor albipictus]|uniref:uncharacterized protein isoform X2 n=1 Tax=Dermacentor albipictus TaxID=60249 RepID=UPI0038FC80A1
MNGTPMMCVEQRCIDVGCDGGSGDATTRTAVLNDTQRHLQQAAVSVPTKEQLKTRRQRIWRMDESYRAAQRARNVERQRRLRANSEYRIREVFKNRLRRQQNRYLRRHCAPFEELSWLQDCFDPEEWESLRSLWPTPAKKRGRPSRHQQTASASVNGSLTEPGAAAVRVTATQVPQVDVTSLGIEAELTALLCWPEVTIGDRSWLFLSVPHSALAKASSVKLTELLPADGTGMYVLPDGRIFPVVGLRK